MYRTVNCRGVNITYLLERKQVKNLNMRIYPDGRVCVSVNRRVTGAQADAFVEGKADVILRTLQKFERRREETEAMEPVREYTKEECMTIFAPMIEEIGALFWQRFGIPVPQLRVRKMTSCWGTCMPGKGVITLNRYLAAAPEPCIRYVVVHEFCHLIHPNHSKQFYELVASILPDWKERRQELEQIGDYMIKR